MTLEKENNEFEIALKLATHINNPCSTIINGQTYDIRPFYLRLARETIPNLTNEHAKEFLESVIRIYK